MFSRRKKMENNDHPIKGVACSFKGKMYYLPAPYRHPDVLQAIKAMNPDHTGPYIGEQGFYDANGLYLSRKEAFDLIIGTKHYISPTPHASGVLFSEDAWKTPGEWGAEPDTDEYKAFHDVYNNKQRAALCTVKTLKECLPDGYPLPFLSRDVYETSGIYIHMSCVDAKLKLPALYSEDYSRIDHHPECTESEKIIAVAKTVKTFLYKHDLLDKVRLGLTDYEHKASNIITN
jgi:hypothetical protein